MALLYRTRLRWRLGQLDGALALSARLLEAAELVPVLAPVAAADRALILLDVGRLDEAEDWCARVDAGRTGSLGYTVMLGHLPRGTLALRRGDLDSACATFTALWAMAEALEVRDPCTVPWAADGIAAYLACGREADAGRLIEWLASPAEALPARWPKVVVSAGRAALAERNDDLETAHHRYTEALALQDEMPIPLTRAQVLTGYGAFLHRQGDASRARPVLAEALRLAEGCGAGWHAERARVEWRRAGGRTGTTPPRQLTPQEAAVARLAKAGKTNQEIAGQLYLTVNTVETHLRHVYQKLGIHRRTDLRAQSIGARPLLLAGSPAVAGGMYWLSRLHEHSSYPGAVLGPMLVTAADLGLLFVSATLVAMSRVRDEESGVAASLRNTGQQIGGAIGLAVFGTIAWTVVANSVRAGAVHATTAAGRAGHAARPSQAGLTAIYHHALAAGFSRAFLAAAAAMLLALVITVVTIRIKRADLGEATL